MNKLTTFILISFIFLTLGFACDFGGGVTEPNLSACITNDGKKIGVGITGKSLIIDVESGNIVKEYNKTKRKGSTVCSADNEILVVYSEEIDNIETGKKTPRRIAGTTIIGINSENHLVGFYGTNLPRQGKPLEVFVEKHYDESDDVKKLTLDLEKLDAVERNKSWFQTKPVKLLKDNKLLVFAGSKAKTIPENEDADMNPDVWGFYKVDLENGEVNPTKAVDKSDYELSVFYLPKTDVTSDGKYVVAGFSHNEEGKTVIVLNLETGEEVFRHNFFKNKAKGRSQYQISRYNAVAISKDATKLAVAAVWGRKAGRTYSTNTVVTIFDLEKKEEINDLKFDENISEIIKFEKDELLLNFDSKSVAKINATDGKEIWKTDLSGR